MRQESLAERPWGATRKRNVAQEMQLRVKTQLLPRRRTFLAAFFRYGVEQRAFKNIHLWRQRWIAPRYANGGRMTGRLGGRERGRWDVAARRFWVTGVLFFRFVSGLQR